MLQRVLLDQAIEVLFQLTGDFGWSPGARAVDQALGALVGKAMDPFSQSGIGERERVGDGLQAVPVDDLAHGLGTAEDTRLFRLFQEGV
jgi:hypothetical protein